MFSQINYCHLSLCTQRTPCKHRVRVPRSAHPSNTPQIEGGARHPAEFILSTHTTTTKHRSCFLTIVLLSQMVFYRRRSSLNEWNVFKTSSRVSLTQFRIFRPYRVHHDQVNVGLWNETKAGLPAPTHLQNPAAPWLRMEVLHISLWPVIRFARSLHYSELTCLI